MASQRYNIMEYPNLLHETKLETSMNPEKVIDKGYCIHADYSVSHDSPFFSVKKRLQFIAKSYGYNKRIYIAYNLS